MIAAGGEVWFGDRETETTLRESPPLRASRARQGVQRVVVVSGRNSRRVVHGALNAALNAATGEGVALVRERSRQDACAAFVEALGRVHPDVPKLLVWDNAPPHHPKKVQATAEAAQNHLAFLPFRSPERMPCEDLWRLAQAVVAANRVYEPVQEQVGRAVAWLASLPPFDRLLKRGRFGLKFQWLST
jgi:transposase